MTSHFKGFVDIVDKMTQSKLKFIEHKQNGSYKRLKATLGISNNEDYFLILSI